MGTMIRICSGCTALFTATLLLGACSEPQAKKAAPAPEAEQPAANPEKPKGWDSDNFFLGRWQGNSTAGRAVLDVLSVEPNRVRWGNAANGICDSDYSVEQLPWGHNGRFPDQLIPPTEPTDLVYGVVRLTLQPRPCDSGVAMVQLAKPLDGSGSLQVVTYDAKGSIRGNFPDLTELPPIPNKAAWPLARTLNGIDSTCRTEPAANDGFTPVGVPTTDRREMVDGSGQRWAMSGHHSFELEEIGGNGNRITVSSARR